MLKIKEKIAGIFSKKDDGGTAIIIEVGILIIGVVLLILFRTELLGILQSVIDSASAKITGLFGA